MREIKFRAWDKETVKMVDLKDDKYSIRVAWEGNLFLVDTSRTDDDGYDYQIDAEFLEYTGLNDKHGKEIYEGDIIKTKGTLWLVEPIGSEERDGNNYGICASPNGSGENYFIDESILSGEVIGNIYENKELI